MSGKMILGAQMYTVRDFTKTNEDFARTMERLAKIGYKYVQVSGIGKEVTPEAIAKASKDTGLKVVLTHTAVDRILNETDKVIEEHDLYGCDGVGIGGIFMYRPFNLESFKRFADDFAPAIEKIKKAGKHFLYHNHMFEFEKCEGKLYLDHILEASPDIEFTLDVHWVQAGGADPAQYIEKYADKIFTTHLKDFTVVDNERKFAAVGEGNMNFDRIIEASVKCGIKNHMVEQDTVPEGADPFDCLETSYKNIMTCYGQYFEQ
ncbi:MAG: sugar phosphate isomerase/epimerase [Clostridia bacterium]|nr:sugar phosphate isomerase/epimerase [Clostridia bacterium]